MNFITNLKKTKKKTLTMHYKKIQKQSKHCDKANMKPGLIKLANNKEEMTTVEKNHANLYSYFLLLLLR